jgi:hypothetical protein
MRVRFPSPAPPKVHQAHRASITGMISHYVSPKGAVIFDHPHNADD